MRYLILSDIHANHLAFRAVLQHAKRQRWDKSIFLGDAVGYYTHPNEVLSLLQDLQPEFCLLGNHEDLLFKLKDNPNLSAVREDSAVTDVLKDHLQQLSSENLSFLKTFLAREQRETWEAVHGGLRSQWEYITTLNSAQENASHMQRPLCFVGHTHVPKVFASVNTPSGDIWRTVAFRGPHAVYRIPPKATVIFNPGSVGQPRDGIPLASYVIFDEDLQTLELFRVEYDLLGMQRLVRERAYPEVLASRLTVGK